MNCRLHGFLPINYVPDLLHRKECFLPLPALLCTWLLLLWAAKPSSGNRRSIQTICPLTGLTTSLLSKPIVGLLSVQAQHPANNPIHKIHFSIIHSLNKPTSIRHYHHPSYVSIRREAVFLFPSVPVNRVLPTKPSTHCRPP